MDLLEWLSIKVIEWPLRKLVKVSAESAIVSLFWASPAIIEFGKHDLFTDITGHCLTKY